MNKTKIVMVEMAEDIGALKVKYKGGITGAGDKWERRTIAEVDKWADKFEPVYKVQLECGKEVSDKGLTGYDALEAFGKCMVTKKVE